MKTFRERDSNEVYLVVTSDQFVTKVFRVFCDTRNMTVKEKSFEKSEAVSLGRFLMRNCVVRTISVMKTSAALMILGISVRKGSWAERENLTKEDLNKDLSWIRLKLGMPAVSEKP